MFDGLKNLTAPLVPASEKPPKPTKRISTGTHVSRALEAAASMADEKKVNPAVSGCLRASAPILAVIARGLVAIAPIYMFVYTKIYQLYKIAPQYAIKMSFGIALCFFGGTFTASIAAIEAFRQMGWQTVYENIEVLISEGERVSLANAKDDLEDDDGDGVADVDQIPAAELAKRKMVVALRSVKEPPRLQSAVAALWGAYLAVLATLRLQFAQTTAIALGIVESIQPPLIRLCVPPLAVLLEPLELGHWTATLVDTSLKLVVIIFAWYVQMIISAYYSAVRGGRIFALALCDKINEAVNMTLPRARSRPHTPARGHVGGCALP